MKPRILFVQDDSENEDLVHETLAHLHFDQYDFCKDAESAIDELHKHPEELPNVVISDFLLPGTDGLELVKQLKSKMDYRGMCFIMYPYLLDEDEKAAMLEAGATGVFIKPSHLEEYGYLLRRIVDLSYAQHKQMDTVGFISKKAS